MKDEKIGPMSAVAGEPPPAPSFPLSVETESDSRRYPALLLTPPHKRHCYFYKAAANSMHAVGAW